jgi:hypothetical protein
MEAIQNAVTPRRGRPRKSRGEIVYNLPATRKRFIKSGRKYRPWAIIKGINPETFAKFMLGTFRPAPGDETERKFLAALESDGLLVLKKKKETAPACSEL